MRPTRQRVTLAALLVGDGRHRHVTAESLFSEVQRQGERVSLATVYNTLRAFCDAGLMQEVTVDGSRSHFDTKTHDHPHFYWEDGRLTDAPADELEIARLPEAPDGAENDYQRRRGDPPAPGLRSAPSTTADKWRNPDARHLPIPASARPTRCSNAVTLTDPVPGPGEVLVRLSLFRRQPVGCQGAGRVARPGVTKPAHSLDHPHSDGAGVIEAVGDGVDAAREGEPVWIWNGQWQRAHGTAAEHRPARRTGGRRCPRGWPPRPARRWAFPGLTAAHDRLRRRRRGRARQLLVSGGARRGGHNAVQLAKWGGAR